MAPQCNAFFAKTFAHMAGAMAVSAASATYSDVGDIVKTNAVWKDFLINLIIVFVLLYAVILTPVGSVYKYVAFIAFAFFLGQVAKPLVRKLDQKDILARVFLLTSAILVGMMTLGFYDNQSILGLGPYLIAGLLGLIIGEVVVYFFVDDKKSAFRIMDMLGAALFSVFAAYDVQVLKVIKTSCGKIKGGPDYPAYSLNLFLDALNLFSNLGDLASD